MQKAAEARKAGCRAKVRHWADMVACHLEQPVRCPDDMSVALLVTWAGASLAWSADSQLQKEELGTDSLSEWTAARPPPRRPIGRHRPLVALQATVEQETMASPLAALFVASNTH